MKYCINCGSENIDQAKFCLKCGNPYNITKDDLPQKREELCQGSINNLRGERERRSYKHQR